MSKETKSAEDIIAETFSAVDKVIQENFHKFVTPTLLTFAEALVHPYYLECYSLDYNMGRYILTVNGYCEIGKCTITREIK